MEHTTLNGRLILVTGAAKRIGKGIALRLAADGARVIIHYNGSEAEARQTSEECGGAPLFRANLESVQEITHMFAAIRSQYGRLDGLVNNAARFTRIKALEITENDWDFIHSVNLKAVFFCSQAAAKVMRENGGGRIVNISSLGGIQAWPEHVHYCSAKAAVIHMTRALSVAFAPDITVNSVAPGVIPFDEAGQPHIRDLVGRTPAGRAGTAGEIADAVVYFLRATNFVTGQTIVVDGGLSQV